MTEAGQGRWFGSPRSMRIVRNILDALIAILLVATVFCLLARYPVYEMGFKLLRYQREVLLVCLVLRLLLAVPWRELWRATHREKATLVFAGVVAFVFIREAILFSGWNTATERTLIDQMAFGGSDAEYIRADIFSSHLLYPDPVFVARLMEQIPESPESRILFLGDQRPFIWAAQVYPRELYCPPRLQQMLIDALQGSWEWTGIVDPLFPVESPLKMPADPKLPPVVEEWQAELKTLIEEKNIEWVVYYDSAWPERRFIHRIDKPVEP